MEQLPSHGMNQLATDLHNASGGGLPEHVKKVREQTETARVLNSWVYILVNGKSDLQNS
jgi:hypothetical protein